MPADLKPILLGQSDFCCHGYFSGQNHVALCKLWILFEGFVCQTEEDVDSLRRDLFDVWVHVCLVSPNCGSLSGFFSHDEEVDGLSLLEAYFFVHVYGCGVVGSHEQADYSIFPR